MADRTRETPLDYRSAGVDIDAGDAVVDGIRDAVGRTLGPRVARGLGHFGGFFRIGPAGPGATLVASADSVGTKLKVAILASNHAGIGEDLVHHCVNDIIACGATPLFFLDYYATGRLQPAHAVEVISSAARACERLGVALIGGETAELPGIYAGDDYDLVGFIVGMVDSARIIDGTHVRSGDILVGVPSLGFHTNGYSLVRAALRLNELGEEPARELLASPLGGGHGETIGEALLTPHRCYWPEVRPLLDQDVVHGMAHITGGGLPGNVGRIIPEGLIAEIDVERWSAPPIMTYVVDAGQIATAESYRAFNMGIGYVIVVAPEHVDIIQRSAPDAIPIGRVVAETGDARVRLIGTETRTGQ